MANKTRSSKGKVIPFKLSKFPYHLGRTQSPREYIHISDATPYKSSAGLTIKAFADNYGWKGCAEIVLERLISLDFPFLTQLDYITQEAKEAFAISVGYDNFIEFKKNQMDIQSKTLEPKKLADIAEILEMHPSELFSKLMYEYAKNKSQQLSEPIKLNVLSDACNISISTVSECIQIGTFKKHLNYYSTISSSDIEHFLNNLKKRRWNYGKHIPAYLEPYANALVENFYKAKGNKFVASAADIKRYEQNLYKEYESLSLLELGKLFQGGKNDDLDAAENDVIKKLIDFKLLLKKDVSIE